MFPLLRQMGCHPVYAQRPWNVGVWGYGGILFIGSSSCVHCLKTKTSKQYTTSTLTD